MNVPCVNAIIIIINIIDRQMSTFVHQSAHTFLSIHCYFRFYLQYLECFTKLYIHL